MPPANDAVKRAVGHTEIMSTEIARTSQALRDQLRESRVAAGLTQKDLADALGISIPYVSQIELGRRDPIVSIVERWAAACGGRVVIKRSDSPNLDLSGLDRSQCQLLTRLAVILPRLDSMLLMTLEQQVRLWGSVIPEQEGVACNDLSRGGGTG